MPKSVKVSGGNVTIRDSQDVLKRFREHSKSSGISLNRLLLTALANAPLPETKAPVDAIERTAAIIDRQAKVFEDYAKGLFPLDAIGPSLRRIADDIRKGNL